jgi:hypothetical protein
MAQNLASKPQRLSVKTLDGVKVEITHADSGVAPDTASGGTYLNSTAVWYKPAGSEWQRSSRYRSAMVVCDIIKHANLSELKEKLT